MYLKAHSEGLNKYDPPNIQGSHSWQPLAWKLPVNMNVSSFFFPERSRLSGSIF